MTTQPYHKTLQALASQESTHWDIADALQAEVRSGYDFDKLATILAARGLEYKTSTLKAYRRVAASFPAGERVAGASFAAHQAALTIGDSRQARVAITRAQQAHPQGQATRHGVLAEVRTMKGRTDSNTSQAVQAWRDLVRSTGQLLALNPDEVVALFVMDGGKAAGEAAKLTTDLTKVSTLVAESLTKAEKALTAKTAKATASKRTETKPTPKPKPKPKVAADRPAPKLRKLGAGRGE